VGEETLRRFVRTAAGDDWEAFFEALFGSEAARAAREPSDRGLRRLIRKRSLPWRDWTTAWVEARQEARRQAREQLRLQAIEERGLVAEGVNLLTARRKSRRIAEAMIAVSAELRAATQAPAVVAAPPSMARAIHQAVEAPEHVLVEREHGLVRPESFWLWELLFGPRTRFLLGAALLVGCLLWVDQNGIVTGAQIKEAAARAVEHSDPLEVLRDTKIDVRIPAQTKPLHLPFLPRPVSNLFQGWGAGAAGLILILSALIRGARMALFALPGAAIAMFGPQVGVPALGPLDSAMASMAIGAGVALLGIVFGRSR
jgi:eukaryotic-like serine/threonine-protein kinase